MGWTEAIEEERRMLMRIAALLFALAGVADRLCARPAAARGFLMWILRIAESVALEFVIDTAESYGTEAPSCPAHPLPAMHGGNSPAEAARLGASLRAMAVFLDWVARHAVTCQVGRAGSWSNRKDQSAFDMAGSQANAVLRLLAASMFTPMPCHHGIAIGSERRDSS
jgi:hypothetical protein